MKDDIMKYIESLKITPTERKNKIIKMIDDDILGNNNCYFIIINFFHNYS